LAGWAIALPIAHDSTTQLAVVKGRLPISHHAQFDEFVGFMQKFQKSYSDTNEVQQRFDIFRDNVRRAAELQRTERGTAQYGVTMFSDETEEEFLRYHTGYRHVDAASNRHKRSTITEEKASYADVVPPAQLDWRQLGYVGPVKDQGKCGSCFVFASIGALEGQWFKKTGRLLSLSEEAVLDCTDFEKCDNGGHPLHAYGDIAEQGGVPETVDYPYVAGKTAKAGECKLNASTFVAYTNGSRAFARFDEENLRRVLAAEGPVNINVNAGPLSYYSGGILDPAQPEGSHPESVTHSVLLVGYGVEAGRPYWIVKNSWTSKWGEGGYFRVQRNKNALYLSDTTPSLPLVL